MKQTSLIGARHVIRLGVAALFSLTAATGALADQIVKIGSVEPLTGGASHLGKDNENGARLAIEEINAQGLTIGGQKITLQLDGQDDAGDPRTATQVAQKLVDEKVAAVVGHLNSGTSIPASKIYSDAGIVQISPSSTNPVYTQQGFKTTYRMVATDAQQGPALASYAQAKAIKTVAVIDDSTAYGQGLANEFEKKAKALGIKVLSHDATNDKAVDFRAILTKIKGENPDAIMYGGMDATGGPLAKQARQLGLRAKLFSGDGVCTEQLSDLAGPAADNVICSQPGAAIETMPGGAAFQAKYQKRFGQIIKFDAPFSYDAVYIIVDAMKRANSTDPAKILAAMPATDHKGVIGETVFDAKGDLKHGVISLYGYKAGKKTFVDEVKM
ncbi:branched-chain amino acid ABC transporter substrate-binding protein [Burkholderia plantarii]|uniref:branched-chain amino acid ABC transporter substrate-binding protein n=1 Tax=Burkholderia plantarii TaxID=41899 RepID=UPI0006D8CDDC|nr:branched-chain amino acid ABC transporter substrate-binding protein [Burkholderia plantarii]ALK33507.1 Extracellular ligand-binding receptor [Burkholderia plantarii]GLZ16682.1 branched chain amino acid ABC transporter substrate-binding protein [Burkholderia plantarii]